MKSQARLRDRSLRATILRTPVFAQAPGLPGLGMQLPINNEPIFFNLHVFALLGYKRCCVHSILNRDDNRLYRDEYFNPHVYSWRKNHSSFPMMGNSRPPSSQGKCISPSPLHPIGKILHTFSFLCQVIFTIIQNF